MDPLALAGCVPGIRDVHQVDERTFEGAISASVGPLNGDFSFSSVITRTDRPGAMDVEMQGVDSVTRSRLETSVQVTLTEDDPAHTTLGYQADVRVKGRLAILGEMVLRATATMMIGQVTSCLRARLERSRAAGSRSGGRLMVRKAFDLVVIGGGTAGCVVAARASEDPDRRVLLVEAGPDPLPVPSIVADPGARASSSWSRPTCGCTTSSGPTGRASPSSRGGSWAAARR